MLDALHVAFAVAASVAIVAIVSALSLRSRLARVRVMRDEALDEIVRLSDALVLEKRRPLRLVNPFGSTAERAIRELCPNAFTGSRDTTGAPLFHD